MNFDTIKLVLARELRDQLRDRRTLFTVIVMPLMLYPLMGMGMMQIAQFMQKTPTRMILVGGESLPGPRLLDDDGYFHPDLIGNDSERTLTEVQPESPQSVWGDLLQMAQHNPDNLTATNILRERMREEKIDLAVLFLDAKPGGQSEAQADQNLVDEQFAAGTSDSDPAESSASESGRVFVFSNAASDRSKLAASRFQRAMGRWRQLLLIEKLQSTSIDLAELGQFEPVVEELSTQNNVRASFWSKILPFVIMIWALTGAFYPAIDLCAGEKERGTLETLLCSPVARGEVVTGKILTTMAFSLTTSVLNLFSMLFTGLFVSRQLGSAVGSLGEIGPPPITAVIWLLIALVPISALFSALSVAIASFARSSKEGQYYLIPLIMVAMPLVMLPMLPSSSLNLGTSLIPLSGLMILLRALIEGHYGLAAAYAGPVCVVNFACCWFAARWAVGQFDKESVLFRASDRIGLGSLVKAVIRDRDDTPLLGHALLCGLLILVLKFFLSLAAPHTITWNSFTRITLITLLATVLMPTVLMALVLTKKPLKTLRLDSLRWRYVPAAILAAVCLHPAFSVLSQAVLQIYPPAAGLAQMQSLFDQVIAQSPGLWAVLLLMAVAPAIVEEIGFRGFVLSGFEKIKNPWWGIVASSLFFGAAHAVIQQSIITFFVGVVLAIVAVRTRSLWACIAFHLTHNCLTLLNSGIHPSISEPWLPGVLYAANGGGFAYAVWATFLLPIAGFMILIWIWNVQEQRPQESFRETLRRWLASKKLADGVAR